MVLSLVTYSEITFPDLIVDRFTDFIGFPYSSKVNTPVAPLTFDNSDKAFLMSSGFLEFALLIALMASKYESYPRAALLVGSEALHYFFAYSIMNL